jgi:hypothetical protein
MVKAVEQVAYATHNFLLIGNGYHEALKKNVRRLNSWYATVVPRWWFTPKS